MHIDDRKKLTPEQLAFKIDADKLLKTAKRRIQQAWRAPTSRSYVAISWLDGVGETTPRYQNLENAYKCARRITARRKAWRDA